MAKTFNFEREKFQSFVDIAEIFRDKYPGEIQSSLAFITYSLTGKYISKYEQRSNWNRRPLRKAQAHYAAMDAYMCEVLYEKLCSEGDHELNLGEGTDKKEKTVKMDMHYSDNFCYGKEN